MSIDQDVAMGQGLDAETLGLMMDGLTEYLADALPLERQLELDHEDICPEDTVRAMSADLGIQLVFVPEAYGGMGGGAMDSYRLCEVMARKDIGLATAIFATFLGSDPILVGATEEQKQQWLGAIAEEGIVFAYGATEPEAGSDLGAMKTKAVPIEAEDGTVTGYRISGAKQWISNGTIADATTILALTPAGPTWFVVPKDTPGFTSAKPEDKHGIRLSNTAALFLDNVEVPVENLIGGVEGKGLVQAQQVFGYTRVMVAAFGLGGGWEAVDRAIAYSKERIAGGSPLAEKQGYTHKLIVPHVARLEAARAFIEETALLIDAGQGHDGALNTEGAIAKYLATEAGNAAAEDAIQAHGGYGYTREYLVEKIKRDVRITTIYEGTSEILEMTIARDRWQEHLKSRGGYYVEMAQAMRALHASRPTVGAETAALALEALAAVFSACQQGRLTRNQHVLFRLGELVAHAECAASLCRRAAASADGALDPKAEQRFDADALAVIARVFAREAALKVADDGLRWVAGSADPALGLDRQLAGTMRLDAIRAAQAGLLADMTALADVLYA
ncbi:MAG: acyl-CoA dehydrogenase family protein [Candidatus Nanopelagicales bacterium]|jgi:alkylation response protein AidB-like acyl-CoA dehydrogenase|nr:acyl-CoA dehydrogenase family protein [Candidatus Nanopelagicales bacterium]